MIVNKDTIQRIINEEFEHYASRRRRQGSLRYGCGQTCRDDLANVPIASLIEFAEAYKRLGSRVTDHLKQIVNNPNAIVHPNSVSTIKEIFGGVNEQLDEAVDAWESDEAVGKEVL